MLLSHRANRMWIRFTLRLERYVILQHILIYCQAYCAGDYTHRSGDSWTVAGNRTLRATGVKTDLRVITSIVPEWTT
jgi:hypothetical protein